MNQRFKQHLNSLVKKEVEEIYAKTLNKNDFLKRTGFESVKRKMMQTVEETESFVTDGTSQFDLTSRVSGRSKHTAVSRRTAKLANE